MSNMDSTPPGAKSTFGSSNGGVSLKWIERELSRLDAGKVDKAHYKPALEGMKEKYESAEKQLDRLGLKLKELRQELEGDITGVMDVANRAKSQAGTHVCTEKERIEAVEKTITFWGTWFLRGLIGMILLLLTAGGGWVYSHVRLEEASKQSSKAVSELKIELDKVHDVQQIQGATLNRIENADKATDPKAMEDALRDVLQEVLDEKKYSR